MKKGFVLVTIVILLAGSVYLYTIPDFEIEAPEEIVLHMGERFSVDDYVNIKGEDIYAEYWDNVNTNKEGNYTLTVTARNRLGETRERQITVIVEF
ncbi:hypothetical protein IMSAG049_00979 [Clostridiales bacterium]|nr:hypothetical protein IMSAG049_00979 [Clostridiales bacterium]